MAHAEATASPQVVLLASGLAAQAGTVRLLQQHDHLLRQHEQVLLASKLEHAKTTWLERSENKFLHS